MTRNLAWILQWARRILDFLVQYNIKSDVAELTPLRQELSDVVGKLTANAAAQETITKQARVQTTEIRRLRHTLRNVHLKPIARLGRTMDLGEIDGNKITFTLPNPNANAEVLAATADAAVNALSVVGPKFTAKGFAPNAAEQLSNVTKALRDAIAERSAQVGRRAGTTAVMLQDGGRALKLVRAIDAIVRPVIQNDPQLLAAWEIAIAMPSPAPKVAKDASTTPPAEPTAPAVTPVTSPAVPAQGQSQAQQATAQ